MSFREFVWKHTHIHKVATSTMRKLFEKSGTVFGRKYRVTFMRSSVYCIHCYEEFYSYKLYVYVEGLTKTEG